MTLISELKELLLDQQIKSTEPGAQLSSQVMYSSEHVQSSGQNH